MIGLQDQFDLAMRAVPAGDMDLLSKVLTDPQSVTIEQQRTIAQRLGIKGGFLAAAVNTFADPVVLVSFLLSRRFPVSGWLKGYIPQRFVGTANEFTGIGLFTRPVETYFRGTRIPKLVALKMQRETEVMRVGQRMLTRMERPNWKQEMPVVSLLMEGQSPAGATPQLRELAKTLRGDMNELWGFLGKAQKVEGGFLGGQIRAATARPYAPGEAPRYLRDYLPHIPLTGTESVMEISGREAVKRMGGGTIAQFLQQKGENLRAVWRPAEADRLTSNFARYQTMMNNVGGEVFNPHLFRRHRLNTALETAQGQEMFITDLNQIGQKYVHAVARTYAINAPISDFERALATTRVAAADGSIKSLIPTNDPIAVQLINEGLNTAKVRMAQAPVAGTDRVQSTVIPGSGHPLMITALRDLVKSVSGRADTSEILFGNIFAAMGRKFDQTRGAVTGRQLAEVDQAVNIVRRTRGYRNIVNGVTSYFYGSTLGLNAWSTLQNAVQPLLTTAPTLGLGPTLAGMRHLGGRIGTYRRTFAAEHRALRTLGGNPMMRVNEAAQRSFDKVFPELAASGIRVDPRLFEVSAESLAASRSGTVFRSIDDLTKFIMQPFTHAEMANQISTFYGAKQAMKTAMRVGEYKAPLTVAGKPMAGEALEQWLNLEAGHVVNATQFRPGPGSRTIFQGLVPAFMRQFLTFPVRLMSHLGESTVRGAMTQQQMAKAGALERVFGGRNWGTVARTALYGRLITSGMREVLGVDLQRALGLTAPFTVYPKGESFIPLPTPPVASLVSQLVSAASNRDVRSMQPMTLPYVGEVPIPKLMVPGGIGLARLFRAINQWQPDMGGFVDQNERLMFRGNTMDFLMASLGIPTDKSRRVRHHMERALGVRTRVRQFRRQFAAAALANDGDRMQQVRAAYSKAFPGAQPLTLDDFDLQRYQRNARLTSLERTFATMGSMGPYLARQVYEVDPDLIAPPTMPMMLKAG